MADRWSDREVKSWTNLDRASDWIVGAVAGFVGLMLVALLLTEVTR